MKKVIEKRYKNLTGITRMCIAFSFILLSFSAKAQLPVTVGGTLVENSIWTDGYTYIVTEDLIVPSGITLTIEPGVRVRFTQQTGLFVQNGALYAVGTESDSIYFESLEGQLWKGISLNTIIGTTSKLGYLKVDRAEIGIDIRSSSSMTVESCRFTNCYFADIRIYNSAGCSILNNDFIKNSRVGLELFASGNSSFSSGNRIAGNFFNDSRYTGLLVRFELGGACRNNIIENNIFNGAEAGIYIDNSLPQNNDAIFIRRNVFMRIGGASIGYSISTGMDNSWISNNIFWQNTRSTVMLRGRNASLIENSFYDNDQCVNLSAKAFDSKLLNNTFTQNTGVVLSLSQVDGLNADSNNIFHNTKTEGGIINLTPKAADLTREYWGSTNTEIINEFIHDFHDDNELGEVIYDPFLTLPDTSAPVSPPYNPIIQLVNGNTLLRWRRNPESDIEGYNLYSGNFSKYSFQDAPVSTQDTVFILNGNQIHENMAVTAFDKNYDGGQPQLHGTESVFAFFRIMPFAGLDTAICSDVGTFRIRNSSIPFHYQSFEWITDGDGTFSNNQLLHPDYMPGEEDIVKGRVILTLKVYNGVEEYEDSFRLKISKLPTVYLNETIFNSHVDYVVLDMANASSYDDLLWTTSGDGFFTDSSALHTTYIIGTEDRLKGEVALQLTVSSACGSQTDEVKVLIRKTFSLRGSVNSKGEGVDGAAVLAITDREGSTHEIAAMVHSSPGGWFVFDTLYEASYRLYAIPDTLWTGKAMPTYYSGKVQWKEGFVLPLTAETYHVKIDLYEPAVALPEGKGSISGRFELPEIINGLEKHCMPWYTEVLQEYCSGGLSNVVIFLYDPMTRYPIRWTITDNEGFFRFRDLPYGSYIVKAEKAGYISESVPHIELNEQFPDRTGIVMRILQDLKIMIFVPEGEEQESPVVYPNPASDKLHISLKSTTGTSRLELYNLHGILNKRVIISNLSEKEVIIDISDLNPGAYIGKLITENQLKGFTFIVK